MKYVIASTSKVDVDKCRAALVGIAGVEYRVGNVPDTWLGCDAAVVWWPLAHEQYGGIPKSGVAQVLFSSLEGDAPEVILATPPGPGGTSGVGPTDPEIEDYTFTSLDESIREYLRLFPGCRDKATILIHLEVAGINRRDMKAPLRGIERFLRVRR
ncbi:hypothetical protein GCM10017771_76550 [Streptomyces capitiformicae]|uniref:Uncharacterized protein n=1 Tax=Streptomyces capitiformicae TaxID=2014920 RepID=A0A918ZJ11_9ACTN|nr:hypothetical protein GCM10017771_76550 [Streptomyces capitiformicae]